MTDLISELASIMRSDINSLNTVAQNSANANTVGYRSERITRVDNQFANALVGAGITDNHLVKIDNSNGSLQVTGKNTHMAIVGDAWFAIAHPNGTMLTRNGNFQINSEGVLVNNQGLLVLGDSGEGIRFNVESSVNSDGIVTHSDGSQDKIQLLSTTTGAQIKSMGEGLYHADTLIKANDDAKVVQHALEGSNVDLAEDMVRIMETTRHIESIQRAMSTYDNLLETGINQIGK